MIAMDFAVDGAALDGQTPAVWSRSGSAEDEACRDEPETAVVFQMTRGGMLKTAGGPVRIAVLLQIQQHGNGRLVAIMLVAALTGRTSWSLRRFSVPVEAECPRDAVRMLGALLPDVLRDIPDGAMLMSDEHGVVLAEVLSRSGRLPRAGAVEIDLRRAAHRSGRGAEASFRSRAESATHRQHA